MSAQRTRWLRSIKKGLDSFGRKVSKALRSWGGAVRRACLIALMLLGIVIVATSVAYASSVPAKVPAVVIAAAGSIVGTSVFCLLLANLVQGRVQEVVQDLEATVQERVELEATVEEMKEQAEQRLQEIRVLERERLQLERDLHRQERMRINVDSLRPILRLALLKIDAAITDFYQKELHSTDPDGPWRGELHEFIGVVEACFKASLGVDLQKVRLRQDDAGRIVVSGISSEFQGLSNLSEEWKLKEVRARKWGGLLPDTHRIMGDDGRVADLIIEQRGSLLDRISRGMDFANLDAGIKRLAREFLTTFLSPLQRELVFVDEDDLPGTQFVEFVEAHNRQLDGLVETLKRRLDERERRLLDGLGSS